MIKQEPGPQEAGLLLRRAAWITVGSTLAGLLLISALLWAANRWAAFPGLEAGGPVSVTDELRPIMELRIALS